MLTLITGGSRSGKSAHALAIADACPAQRKYFVATAEALDEEMSRRIEHHRRSRSAEFETIEEPRSLRSAIAALASHADLLVVDCLTLWISNLMGERLSDEAILAEADALSEILGGLGFPAIVVTDEVGWGIVPDNSVARRFRDLLGWTNQKIARAADQVLLMVAGYPLRLK
ncbi:MAG TPA: bifunctional adenosylcobinamide kinase/adenosylcobinamide-phosphate guanylyltransferase [Candidatus Binataceae bacterium]|nr:bifunctional adenosylcobinamide kinase/adenosylcobinamide-phosphate guanylyltransferase [Candidatus Binataceae bacterium]